jgi:hypothetical protein
VEDHPSRTDSVSVCGNQVWMCANGTCAVTTSSPLTSR